MYIYTTGQPKVEQLREGPVLAVLAAAARVQGLGFRV